MFSHLEFFLQAIHLGPQGVNNVLPVFQHEVFQLLRGLHLLNVLPNDKKQREKRKKLRNFNIIGNNNGRENRCMLVAKEKKK